uniref:Stabilin 2 n=1 Tax=Canis lupus dingo TaxID=286419 RepID=A0A8C0LL21_CANLU
AGTRAVALVMPRGLAAFLLGLLVAGVGSPPEAAGQANRCDKKSLLTIRTECQSCSLNLGINCPDGYTKVTNGSMGVRDCRYAFDIRKYSLYLPGCRHICRKDHVQPQCCPGHWGPNCMGKWHTKGMSLYLHLPNIPHVSRGFLPLAQERDKHSTYISPLTFCGDDM